MLTLTAKQVAKTTLLSTILAFSTISTLSHAEDMVVTKAAPRSNLQVAIVPFSGAEAISAIVTNHLTKSGQIASSDNLPEQPHSRNEIHLELWQAQSVPYMVVGSASGRGNDVVINYDVVDVNSGQVLGSLNQKTKNNPQSLAVAGYAIADKINALFTNTKSDFDGKIAYVVSTGKGAKMSSRLIVSNADGSNPVTLQTVKGIIMSLYPSLDGRHFTFTSKRMDVFAYPVAWGVDITNNSITPLTPFAANNGSASISPDGSQVLFSSDYNKLDNSNKLPNREIHLAGYGSASPQRLTNNEALDLSPSWLPDGRSYIFTSDRDGGNNHPNIYRATLGSNAVQRLTSGSYNTSGRVSLDGTKMSYVSGSQGAVMDLRTGATIIVNASPMQEAPNISPSGKYYIYATGNAITMNFLGKTVAINPSLYGVAQGTVHEPVWLKPAN